MTLSEHLTAIGLPLDLSAFVLIFLSGFLAGVLFMAVDQWFANRGRDDG